MSECVSKSPSEKRDFLVRLVVLGTLYGLALVFAIAFSPSAGLMPQHQTGEIGRLAAAPEHATR